MGRPHRRPKRGWEDNIEIALEEIQVFNRIALAEDRVCEHGHENYASTKSMEFLE
jgi:hypothetical protein